MLKPTQKRWLIGGMLLLLLTVSGGLTIAQDATAYTVDINPANFKQVVDNPYYPRIAGMRWVYEGQTADGLERIEREVLTETREIMGVQATIMRDTGYIDGIIKDDTLDYFAQDNDSTVWYFGEETQNYENGQPTDTAGSWMAGVDGALPGIIMYGDPAAHIGESYRQQYSVGQAEDMADLISISGGGVSVPYGSFDNVVLTYEYTPLDTSAHEIKFFAKGIGAIKMVDFITDDIFVLVEFTSA